MSVAWGLEPFPAWVSLSALYSTAAWHTDACKFVDRWYKNTLFCRLGWEFACEKGINGTSKHMGRPRR